MLKQFRTYQVSLRFYQACVLLKLPRHLKDQLLRAASSITLNLAEGSAKPTKKDQMKFYFIAFGSLRECQAILSLSNQSSSSLLDQADHLGACLYRLTRALNHYFRHHTFGPNTALATLWSLLVQLNRLPYMAWLAIRLITYEQ